MDKPVLEVAIEQGQKLGACIDTLNYPVLQALDGARPAGLTLTNLTQLVSQQLDGGAVRTNHVLEVLRLLEKSNLVRIDREQEWAELTLLGLDAIEGRLEEYAPLTCVASQELQRRRELRWRILRVLDAARPLGVTTRLLYLALSDSRLLPNPSDLGREMAVLRSLFLIEVGSLTSLTTAGIEVLEYARACPLAIDRPPQSWEG
jgi:hypothetical protein